MRRFVDAEGWLVPTPPPTKQAKSPYPDTLTIEEHALRNSRPFFERDPGAVEEYKKQFFFWSAGVYPKEYSEKWQRDYLALQAEDFPLIPHWLGENPPLATVFVPNGEILTYGPLGLHVIDPRGPMYERMPAGESWYRYTADGRLLDVFTPTADVGPFNEGDWQDIYANWRALEDGLREKGILNFSVHKLYGGARALTLYELVDMVDRNAKWQKPTKVLAAYDFQGRPLDPSDPLPVNNWNVGTSVDRKRIEQMYKVQVELGLTDASSASPWAGTAEGPVAVDPSPRPSKKLARKMGGVPSPSGGYFSRTESSIVIKPFDDPGNPYRGQYGPWDEWLLENYGMQNPRMNEFFNEQYKREQEEAAKAKQENRKPDFSKQQLGYYNADDPWKTFDVQVDDQGYQIPKVQGRAMRENRWRKQADDYDLRQPRVQQPYEQTFSYNAGGVMPKEMQDALQAAEMAAIEPDGISVPDWLAASPPRWVIFIPNGEIVTSELGVYDPDEYKKPEAERKKGTGWYRYSADGQLLGHAGGEKPNWQQFYAPQFPALEMSGKSQGYEVEHALGYLIWRRPKDQGGEAVAAWDYDGTPLSLDQPLRRPRGVLRMYQWGEVVWQMKLNKSHGK